MSYEGYSRLKALVIDDFDNFRMTLCKMLHSLGVEEVDTAISGVLAVNACKAKAYNLILCDYNLGTGKNGQQVLEELRDRKMLRRSSLFVLISAETDKSMIMATYDDEPDAYLTKPITGKALEQRLNRLLRQRDELMPVYNALDSGDTAKAIELCRAAVERDSRHTTLCQKLLGNLYLETGDYAQAEKLYRRVLEVRALDWAQVGLSKVKQALGDLATSDKWLRDIIGNNPLCMQAYDVLAKNCEQRGDSLGLQEVLQQAVTISPLSIVRQQNLAQVALANNELDVAATAYRRAVRLGQHSCRDRVENHLNFGRTTAALFKQDDQLAYNLSRDALRALAEIEQRFVPEPELQLQARLIESQVYAGQGNKAKAEEVLLEVKQDLENQPELSVDSELDHVAALAALGKEPQSKLLLENLIERYRHDQAALEKIDRLLEEPLSEHNRRRVAKLNRNGIQLHEAGRYQEAIDCFRQAKRLFPNHIGVHLNLVQALLAEMEEYGRKDDMMELCLATLKKINCRISPAHGQYHRYLQLQERAKTLETGEWRVEN